MNYQELQGWLSNELQSRPSPDELLSQGILLEELAPSLPITMDNTELDITELEEDNKIKCKAISSTICEIKMRLLYGYMREQQNEINVSQEIPKELYTVIGSFYDLSCLGMDYKTKCLSNRTKNHDPYLDEDQLSNMNIRFLNIEDMSSPWYHHNLCTICVIIINKM